MKPTNNFISLTLNPHKIRFALPIFLASILFGSANLQATVEGGAVVTGTVLSDNNATVANTAKAIKWSTTDIDLGTFDFNASNPTRLKVKSSGNYFVAFTGPILEQTKTSSNRSQVEFVIHKNGSAIPEGSTRSTYVRHDSSHTEASGHMYLLIPNLSANDYLEVFVKNIDSHSNTVRLGICTLFSEKIANTRTVFSATATRTVAGQNLNPATFSALQWDHDVANSGFTHSDSTNSQNINLDSAANYLVYVNLPLQSGGGRVSPEMIVKLGGNTVTGGGASQGYLRGADGINKSSLHWVGLVTSGAANQTLTVEIQRRTLTTSNTTVPSGEKGSIFIEKLANSDSLFSATATQTTASDPNDWNKPGSVKWATQETIDAAKYTHAIDSNAHQVTVDQDGDYLLLYSDELNSTYMRVNPQMSVNVNGNLIAGTLASSHYIRADGGHNHSSTALVSLLSNLKANDTVSINITPEALTNAAASQRPARLVLLKKPTVAAPVFTVAQTAGSSPISGSVTFKQDGTNVSVTNFTDSDITATNANISNFSGSGHTYTFNIVPTTYPAIINLSVAAGAATTTSGGLTAAGSGLTQFRNTVTLDNNLVLYLPFDEGTGTTTLDRSSSGKNGTLVGDPTWVAGKRGFALELDGTGDSVSVPGFTGVTGTNAFSIALWAKSIENNSTHQQSIASWGQNTSTDASGSTPAYGFRATLNFDAGKFRLDNAKSSAATANSFYDGNWHHLVVVKAADGNMSAVTFYVDGSAVSKSGQNGGTFNISALQNFHIGADTTGRGNTINFTGTIDDFRLYSVELNATAASTLYASGVGEGYYTPTLPVITVSEYSTASPIPVSVTFKRGGSNFPVSGFTTSDLTLSGGTASGFSGSGGGGHTYTFNVNPTTLPSSLSLTIPKNAAAGGGGVYGNDVASVNFNASYGASLSTSGMEGIEMWYDATDLNGDGTTDTGYSVGSAVNSWTDKSGNGYNMIGAGNPTWAKFGNNGVVNFDGTGDALYSTNHWGGGAKFTMFSVARYTHADGNGRVIADRTRNWYFGFQSGQMQKWHFDAWLTNINHQKDQLFHIHSASMNDADQGNTYFDGTQVGPVNGTGAHDTTYMPKQLQFGGYGTSSEYSKCEVAEFIAFNRVISKEERLAIEGYLAHKWGLTARLPSGHTNLGTPSGIGSGLAPEFSATSPTQTYPVPVTVTFKKDGANQSVSSFSNGFSTSFKPGTLSGLTLWLDANDASSLVHSSNVLSMWKDKSGRRYNAVQTTSASQPTVVASGLASKPVIRFDGTNDWLDVGNIRSTSGAVEAYVVAQSSDSADGAYQRVLSCWNGSGNEWDAPNWKIDRPGNDGSGNPANFSAQTINSQAASGRHLAGLKIARNAAGDYNYLGADLAEILIYDTVLSASDRQKIEGYLAHKWGLTGALSDSHPFKSNQPTSVGLSNNAVSIEGATIASVTGSGASYVLNLNPTTNPSRIKVKVKEGAANSVATGEKSSAAYKEILYRPSVLKESNLALFFPLGEEENATTVHDWGPHGLKGKVDGTVGRYPGVTGSSFRFDGSANNKITIPNHRAMRMTNNGQYTLNAWIRYEVHTSAWGSVFTRNGRNYYFQFGNHNNANGGFVHHRFRMGSNADPAVVGGAYRVSPEQWSMITLTNQGNPGVAKTYINGGLIQSASVTDTVWVEQDNNIHIGANGNGNGEWFKGSLQNIRLYNVAFTDSEVNNLYSVVNSESGAVVISTDTLVPFNAGTSLSIQPTFTVPVSVYAPTWTESGLPSELNIDASTGAITGTVTGTPANTGTDYSVNLMATNGFGKSTKAIIFKAYPLPSSITDSGATDLGMYGATLKGSFTDVTGTSCKVHFLVDTADRGDSNVSAWAQHYVLENQSSGAFSRVLSGLTFNSTYRYRLAVENAGGSLKWTGSAGTFTTLAGLTAPTLGEVNASNTVSSLITPAASTATLNGTLTSTGGENPTVYFVWGDNDAGTDYASLSSWDYQVAMGVLGTGSFSTNLTGLQAGKVYYFRTAASNGSGSVISDSLGIFSTSNAGGLTASPTTISPANLKIWLDADTASTLWQDAAASSAAGNGNSLALWQDKSGNGYHFAQTTAGDRPTVQSNQINSKPAVLFTQDTEDNGDDMRVNSPSADFPTAASWFAIVKLNESSKRYNIIGTNSLNNDRFINVNESRPSSFLNYRATLNSYYASFPSTGTHLFSYESDASVFRITLNGTELATSGAGYSPGNGTYWQIGNRFDNGQALNGHIGELLVMNTVLPSSGRQAMEGYLAHKWGLAGSLPSSHLFKSSTTSSAAPVISSASSASATVGAAFSYNIATNVANPSFQAANLPPGLTCNLGTGAITGSPLAGGVYTVTLSAQSSSSALSATKILTITIPVSAPLLAVEAPGNLVMNGAKLKGLVTNTGGRDPSITVFWGDNNASTTAENWDYNATLGSKSAVALAYDVTGLTGGTSYYYTFNGVNTSGGTGGSSWSKVQSFTTPTSVSAPILGALHAATEITSSAAKFNVNLQSTGGDTTTLKFYWGDNDGGTIAASWDNIITVNNAQPGNLIGEITSGLSAPTIYYFRAKASNWVGDTWASATVSFTPSALQTSPTRAANLLGWWKFDDDTNATVKDSSGNNNHGLLKNSSHSNVSTQHKTDTPTGTGKSIDLNGNHYVVVSTTGQNTFDGGNQFTIAAWIKELPSDNWSPWISKRGESDGWQIRRYGGQVQLTFTLRGIGESELVGNINPSNWTHLTGVWGGGKRKIFINGALSHSEDRSGAVNITDSALVFGARDDSGNYNPASPTITKYSNIWLDDVRFYNVFLSDSEVSRIYGGGLGDVGQPWINVTSATSATAATGMAFTYQITATNSPTTFSLADAPGWMSVNAATGVVSGTPTAGGVVTFKVGASNANGTDFQQVSVTIGDNAPFEYSLQLTTDLTGMSRSATLAEASISSTAPAHTTYALAKVFDQDKGTGGGGNRWMPMQSALPNVDLIWQFTNPFRVTSYKILGQSEVFADRGPKAFILYGSNNGTSWTTVDDMNASSSNHQTSWTSNQERTFTVDSPGDYTYYKLLITQASGTNTYLGIREVDLIGVDYTPLSDFNLLVTLDENNATFKAAGFRHSLCKPNGEDLRFQSSTGMELKYEITSWNQSGKSIVWVNLPSLARNDVIFMRWGNTAAAAPSYVSDGSAWSNYLGVYHLDQAQGAAALDSGPHDNHAPINNTSYSPDYNSTSISGGAYVFTKNTGSGFKSSSISGTLNLDNFSAGVWINGQQDDAQNWGGYWAMGTDSGGDIRLSANNVDPPRALVAGGDDSDGINAYTWDTTPTKMQAGAWKHVYFTSSGGKGTIYLNGAFQESKDMQDSSKVTEIMLGKRRDANAAGAVQDEMTFHKIARHERWVNAAYYSQVPGNTYVNMANLAGPPYFDDTTTEIFAKKNVEMTPFTPTALGGGSIAYTAAGLPPGISINSTNGQITGTTDETGASAFTVTASGTNAAGATRTASKTYTLKVSDPDAYPFRLPLTLAGYTGSSTLTQFPILVELNSSITGFTYNSFASATGGDLRFFAADGEELPYEIESWYPNGTSRVWVRSGSISGTNSVITAAWGDSTQTTAPSYVTDGSAWSNGYHGAWHFQDLVGTTLADSGSKNFHGTGVGGPTIAAGQVGNSISFDGTDDYVNFGKDAGNIGTVFTVTFWAKMSGGDNNPRLFGNKSQSSGTVGWEIYKGTSTNVLYYRGSSNTSRSKTMLSSGSWNDGNWVHIALCVDGGLLRWFANGIDKGTSTGATPVVSTTSDLRMGDTEHNTHHIQACFDEVRIANVRRTNDWIKASFDNQKSTGTRLVSYGSVVGPRMITSP
ncbi:MAG: hypothetical protein CBC82_03825, partial [Cellvibrionales bacterium TMED122]